MRNLPRILIPLALSASLAACSNTTGGGAATGEGGAPGLGGGSGVGTGGTTGATGGMTGGIGGSTGSAGSTGTAGRGAGGAPVGTGGTTAGTAGSTGALGGSTGTTTSVLIHHNNPSRDGVYVDARLTRAAAATMHADATFANTALMGPVYAQPLYLGGAPTTGDMLVVASAQNHVTALNAANGARLWDVALGTPVTTGLCGRPLNPLGIVGTPVIDPASRTVYLNAMTATAANGARHMAHALALDGQGAERAGWPIDLTATARSGNITFDSPVQNQRAALILVGGKVFIPFGGHIGDCLGYHGWIVGINATGTPQVSAWSTTAFAGGIWGSSGIASDGTSLVVTTGNTKLAANSGGNGTTPGDGNWGGGEAVIRFPTTLVQPAPTATREYFVPGDWTNLDITDADIGGTGPILMRVPGATPSNLIVALGKDRKAYLLDAANLGGLDASPLTSLTVANGVIIQAAVAYTTATGSYVVFKGTGVGCPGGQTGGLTAIRVSAASPPALSIAWCAGVTATSSPAVSVTDAQGANAVVWYVGNDARLHGLNGDTGASVLADTTALGTVVAHQTPIVANGRIFVASNTRVFAFTP